MFEGEGAVYTSVRAGRPRRRVCMNVRMCDEDVVRRFHAAVECGVVSGPLKAYGVGTKPVWEWRVSAYADIDGLFRVFRPWLCARRIAQFKRALAVRPAYQRRVHVGIGNVR